MKSILAAGVVLLGLSGGASCSGGLIVAQAAASGHASLQNYPDAVVSAQDGSSGIALAVEPDGRRVTATAEDGAILWSVDVVDAAGKPTTGFPLVRLVKIQKPGTAMLVIGKSRTVEIDLASGRTKILGED